MAKIIKNEDQIWIDAGKTDDQKALRKAAILNLIEMNGLKFDAGIGKSYIPEKNFFQIVNDKDVPADVNNLATAAMNWHALGRNIGGLAGAGVRTALIDLIDPNRECTTYYKFTEEIENIVGEFVAFTEGRKDMFPFWGVQAFNVLGLAGAIFNREMHHWNAENTRPQMALLAALNQQDTIPDNEMRKLFYLSIHPVPLSQMEKVRQSIVDGKRAGINDAVTSRCKSAPAGTGDFHACAQAIGDLTSETFYGKFGNTIRDEMAALSNLNHDLINHAGRYHAFAVTYGYERILVERTKFKRAMICLCAYIYVNIKGSLAQSAALKKFRNANARMVQKWIAAFEADTSSETLSILDLAKD